jgi:predicted DNA-binding transcriptional regulator AlpA
MPRKPITAQAPAERAPHLPVKLLEVNEVASFLQVGRTRVFQLMREEGLPFLKWDRTLRFDPNDIARWLEEQKQRSA